LTVQEALGRAAIDAREARLLLAAATGFSEATVMAFQERDLPREAEARFRDFTERRKSGEPVAYILGHKEFYGLELAVNPAVLIPRPETELLVELALRRKPESALDLGTGSGAIALAIKKHLSGCNVTAIEVSAAALAVAQRNAVKHNLEIEFLHGRWLGPLGGRRFELIASNPPYVAAGDAHLAELRFEPPPALVSGADGLNAIREICRDAPAHLEPRGWLLLEHGAGQDSAVRRLLEESGLEEVASWPDLSGIPRVSGGRR